VPKELKRWFLDRLAAYLRDRPLLAFHDFGDNLVVRRYSGNLASQLEELVRRHAVEFHEVLREKDDVVWIDIDPGSKVPFRVVKAIVKELYDYLRNNIPLRSFMEIFFSGKRGFYIRIYLPEERPVNELRDWLKRIVDDFYQVSRHKKWLSKSVRADDKVKLDISTYHVLGSIRAPFSIAHETGLMSVPVRYSDLDSFTPALAHPGELDYRKQASEILQPASYELPPDGTYDVIMVIQEHDALKAGLHWDLRLVDRLRGVAYSWVIPKARFPIGSEVLLAIQTPNHSVSYSLYFEGKIPEGEYGAGTVRIIYKKPAKMKKEGKKIRIKAGNDKFVLIRTTDKRWLLRKVR